LKLLSQFSDKFEQAIGFIQLIDQLFGVIQLWITSQHCKLGRKNFKYNKNIFKQQMMKSLAHIRNGMDKDSVELRFEINL
jgi:hypothetical protein